MIDSDGRVRADEEPISQILKTLGPLKGGFYLAYELLHFNLIRHEHLYGWDARYGLDSNLPVRSRNQGPLVGQLWLL